MGILTGQLHKLVFGGTLAVTETWACSIHLMTQGLETEDDAAALTAVQSPITDWFGRPQSNLTQIATLNYIKLNAVDKGTGRYADTAASNTIFLGPPQAPGGALSPNPPQLTQALSWHTDVIRGRASHGRVYPPSGIASSGGGLVLADGRMSAAVCLEMANSAQELLAELNNATANLTCVVWSQIGQVGRAVERVSVGRIVDTQRRRRANLIEERVFAAANV